MCDYLLGGKDHFAVDQTAALEVRAYPPIGMLASSG
jgi:hypothetical protein